MVVAVNTGRALFERAKFATLAAARVQKGSAAPCELVIPAVPGMVIVPTYIQARTQIEARALTSLIREPLVQALDTREFWIERVDEGLNAIVGVDYFLRHCSDYDREFEAVTEAGALAQDGVLIGSGLRLRFNAIDATHEKQYILVNYKVVDPPEADRI